MADTDAKLMGDFPPVSYERWRERVEQDLKGADFDKRLVSRTLDGIDVQPIYVRSDWPGEADQAGVPGHAPYRRGVRLEGRFGDSWDMRQRYAATEPAQVKADIEADRSRGVRSLWLCLDSGIGDGELKGDGLAATDAQSLAEALGSASLSDCPVMLEAPGSALAASATLIATAAKTGVDPSQLHGGFGADPLAALARSGRLAGSYAAAEKELVALARYVNTHAANMRAATVSTAPYHDAGASAAQEIGIALATGLSYLRAMTDGHLNVDVAAKNLLFSVSVAGDFFMEMAKLRALRQTWAQVVAACGGAEDAQMPVIHARTSARTKTVRDPWVNMLRATTETFSAAVGGADAITSDSFDVAIGQPDGFARRIASNMQVVLNEESHVAQVADPAGGSYYVEHLTDQLAEKGWAVLQAIEAEGGMLKALQSGFIAGQLEQTAKQREGLFRKRKQAITGVSEYANIAEKKVERPTPKPGTVSTRGSLSFSHDGAELVEEAVKAAQGGASLAAITAAVNSGESVTCAALPVRRDAALYEALRDRSDAFLEAQGKRPQAFLANLGPIPKHKARSSFAAGFLQAGGIECLDNDGFQDAAAAAGAYGESGAPIAVLCGGDDQYESWVTELAPKLQAKGAKAILLAGRGGDNEARYREAGVTDFIFMGSDVVATLDALLNTVGAK